MEYKNAGFWIKNIGLKYIIIFFVSLSLFFSIILVNFIFVRENIRENAVSTGLSDTSQGAEDFFDFLTMSKRAINFAAKSVERMAEKNVSVDEMQDYLVEISENFTDSIYSSFDGIYGCYRDSYVDGERWTPPDDYDIKSRPWYQTAVEADGETVLVEPYLDMQSGEMLTCACKLLSDRKTVLALDISLAGLQESVSNIDPNSTMNQAFIISRSGFIVTSPDMPLIGKNIYESGMILETMEPGFVQWPKYRTNIVYNGVDYEVYFRELYDGWYAIAAISTLEAMFKQNLFTVLEIVALLAVMIVLILLIYHITKKNMESNSLNTRILSVSNIYLSLYSIDIENNSYETINTTEAAMEARRITGGVQTNVRECLRNGTLLLTDDEYKKKIDEFIDLDTLNERMGEEDTITAEFYTTTGMYCRGRFVVEKRDEYGKITNVLWMVENIDKEMREKLRLRSQRRAAEQERLIAESEKKHADEANKAKSSFLSNMSHEIRTPINSIIGMNEMILRECNDPNILAYAKNAKVSSNTLLGLVNDILDFSKLEAGKLDIIHVDYEIASVLNDLVNMIRNRIEDKGLAFNVNVDPTLPVILNGDEVRIKQIITNILTNAAKYTQKGSVTMSVNCKRLPIEKAIEMTVTVEDTGIGIKPEDISKLFSAFERIEEKRNRAIEGTGLGMNITQSLLKMMGSRLEVSSVYGEGSTFSFTVKQRIIKDEPIGDFESSFRNFSADNKKYKEKFIAPKAKVLVVDDTDMNLTVFVSLLKTTQMRIDTAESGQKGLNLCEVNDYDIIFLDHRMPGMDGVEVLHELKAMKDNHNSRVPLICLTANALSGARQEYIDAGFDDYLTKPIDPDKLEETIEAYLPKELITKVVEEQSEPQASSIPDFVYDIEELNVEEGRKHFPSEEMYMDMLKIYANTVFEHIENIKALWEAKDISALAIKIHAVKSSTRSIGGIELGELAQKLETAGDNNDMDTLNAQMDDFIAAVSKLGTKLESLVSDKQVDESDLPPITKENLEKCYGMIKKCLDSFDTESIEEIITKINRHSIPDDEKERCKALSKALDDFDFEAMMDILN